jgi:hypothetical protein
LHPGQSAERISLRRSTAQSGDAPRLEVSVVKRPTDPDSGINIAQVDVGANALYKNSLYFDATVAAHDFLSVGMVGYETVQGLGDAMLVAAQAVPAQ